MHFQGGFRFLHQPPFSGCPFSTPGQGLDQPFLNGMHLGRMPVAKLWQEEIGQRSEEHTSELQSH